jgi:hypothetical protein
VSVTSIKWQRDVLGGRRRRLGLTVAAQFYGTVPPSPGPSLCMAPRQMRHIRATSFPLHLDQSTCLHPLAGLGVFLFPLLADCD